MEINSQHVRRAYRKLKRYVYYDKTDLHLRRRLAAYECSKDFKRGFRKIADVLNDADLENNAELRSWLDEIKYRLVVKSLENCNAVAQNSTEHGKYISNVTSRNRLVVEKVNYFFDGPIELHLIAVLWIMFEGRYLDRKLGRECFGARLSSRVHDENDDSAELFIKYHEQYSRWRDNGIRKAKQLLVEEQSSVSILGLDIQEYYYSISLNFQKLASAISAAKVDVDAENSYQPSGLLRCLDLIHAEYRKRIADVMQYTHEDARSIGAGIPIGLCSSQLLANWYLMPFDKEIKRKIKPAYYGRYVDDILLVIETADDPGDKEDRDPIETFINDALVHGGVLHPPEDGRYEIKKPAGLFLQQSKCILQFFDVDHSIAGLEKFQKKLEENGSDFLLLPVDEADHALEDVAYELTYEGSINKFRSVKGTSENRYELAKNLAKKTILHLLTNDPPSADVGLGLRKFFKGKNAILFHDLWERVFTYFVVSEDESSAIEFEKDIGREVRRVFSKQKKRAITEALRSNLEMHLSLSKAMAKGLKVPEEPDLVGFDYAELQFRKSNLIRATLIKSQHLR